MKISRRILIVLLSSVLLFSSCNKTDEDDFSDKILAVETASLSTEAAKLIRGDFGDVKEFSSRDAVVSAVETKVADYIVLDEFSAGLYMGNKRKIRFVKEISFTTDYYIYFQKGDEYVAKFNKALLELSENGTIDEIKAAYKSGEAYYPQLIELPSFAPTLTAGIAIVGEPYSDLDEAGYVTGIDVNIAELTANSLGCKLEIVVDSGESIFKMLQEGKVDFIISGLLYEEERLNEFDCTFSYLTTEYALYERG